MKQERAKQATVADDAGAALYVAAQVRELDRRAIEDDGVPAYELMRRAAAASWRALRERRPRARRIAVFCGPGNNGGDGYEIACLASDEGCEVRVWTLGTPAAQGPAAEARGAWLRRGAAQPYAGEPVADVDAVVDAIYGIGITRPVEGAARTAIEAINTARGSGAFVLAVDLPSGLDADTGRVHGAAVRADLTVAFIGRKLGVYTGEGPEYAGERMFDALSLPPRAEPAPIARLLHEDQLRRALPRRPRGAHKGRHGLVLLVGGDAGYAGAILLAARAALRAGAGLVTVATRSTHTIALTAAQPEAMFRGIEAADDLLPLLRRADVVAVGPGLGRAEWGQALWQAVMSCDKPLVVDADALNLLAESPARGSWVLTPHPGEAARLLACSVADVEADRLSAVRDLQSRYGGAVVLKGAGSLIAGEQGVAVCPYGNPGMAAGGSGDVLTGVIAALIGQGLNPEIAARMGVMAHALAGDRAAAAGERGLLPGDLIAELRAVLN